MLSGPSACENTPWPHTLGGMGEERIWVSPSMRTECATSQAGQAATLAPSRHHRWPAAPTTSATPLSPCGSTRACPSPKSPATPATASPSCSRSTPTASTARPAPPTSASATPSTDTTASEEGTARKAKQGGGPGGVRSGSMARVRRPGGRHEANIRNYRALCVVVRSARPSARNCESGHGVLEAVPVRHGGGRKDRADSIDSSHAAA